MRWFVVLALLLGFGVSVLAAYSGVLVRTTDENQRDAPGTFTVTGVARVDDSSLVEFDESSEACNTTEALATAGVGAQVLVVDAAGQVVGSGRLRSGSARSGRDACVFPFTVTAADGGTTFAVRVRGQEPVKFDRDDPNGVRVELTR